MAFDTILLTMSHGACRLTLNRPERLNAFNARMHAEVAEALSQVENWAEARVLVITGAGRGFCAGQDLSERSRAPGAPTPDLGRSLDQTYNPLVRRLTELPIPVVCAVNGVAAGAGANLALAADIVIAKSSARFIQSFVNIGLLPDCGGTWTLPRLAGQARALGLALTGEPLAAPKAEAWGLIWRAAPDDDFDDEVRTLVDRLAKAPTLALAAIKNAVRTACGRTLSEQLDAERDLQGALGLSSDYAEGVAAFNEKRPAEFRGV